MKKQTYRILSLLLILTFTLTVLAGCGNSTAPGPQGGSSPATEATEPQKTVRQVTDAAGNVVEVPGELSRIGVTPLPWSSVIYAIDGSSERMVSINPGAMKAYTGSFFEKLDSRYADLDTTSIGTDFSINMEEMVKRNVEAMVIWDYQTDEAQQLKALGIVPVMVKNETLADLQNSFTAIGQMLGKEDRARQFNELYTETYDYLKSYSGQIDEAKKPRILYLRNKELKLQGSNMFIEEALTLAGSDNVAPSLASITMEEILKLDPEIILLSNFDAFVPEDLYGNKIEGQDWSSVSAVVNKRVYKVPMGIYRWDAPGVETPLMILWLAQLVQPEIFADLNAEQKTADYFRNLFDYTLTDKDLDQIFAKAANAGSL